MQARYGQLVDQLFGPGREKDEKRRKELSAEYDKVAARYQELSQKLPPESESHGWVWLFLRRPGADGPGGNGR